MGCQQQNRAGSAAAKACALRGPGPRSSRAGRGPRRLREIAGVAQGLQTEARHEDRVIGRREGLEDVGQEPLVIPHEGREQFPPGPAVGAQIVGRFLERPVQAQRPVALEGVGKRDLGLDPPETVAIETDPAEKGDARARGWTAEQTSWTKPGRVNSAKRAPQIFPFLKISFHGGSFVPSVGFSQSIPGVPRHCT
jgi:hypothetical protein